MRFKPCEIKMMVQMIITTIYVVVISLPFGNRSILSVTGLLGVIGLLGGQSQKGSWRCRHELDD